MDFEVNSDTQCELRINKDLLHQTNLINSYKDLEVACTGTYALARGGRASESRDLQLGVSSSKVNIHHNRSALYNLRQRLAIEAEEGWNRVPHEFFGDLLRGAGIAELSGPSGSGKTSYCLSVANNSSGLTLYLDTCGSVCLSRVLQRDKFLYLRLFDSDELDRVVSDFANRLEGDNYLPCFSDTRARTISTLVIDSLWPLSLLDITQRTKYLLHLCATLREISWRFNVRVLVCNNEAKADNRFCDTDKDIYQESLKERFSSRCYLQISLDQRVCFDKDCGGFCRNDHLGRSFSPGTKTLNRFLISVRDRVNKTDQSCISSSVENNSCATPSSSVVSPHASDVHISANQNDEASKTSFVRNAPLKRTVHHTSSTHEDHDESLANICVLRGQTGCGKISAVRRLCNDIGLKIIEYDPFETDVVYMTEHGSYDAIAATFLRFLDTVRRKPGLRVTKDSILGSSSGKNHIVSQRGKRLRLNTPLPSVGTAHNTDTTSSLEPHVVLLKDIPRTLTGNNDCTRRIQEITRSILDGEGCVDGITTYPLLICVNNTSSDHQLLRNILPFNYKNHPRCLTLNVNQITKTNLRAILHRHLEILKRNRTAFNEKLVDFISNISCGDLRFAIANLHFYSSISIDSTKSSKDELEAITAHISERNANSIVFNILGKVLVNKRIPIILQENNDSTNVDIDHAGSVQGSSAIDRFGYCFRLSRPLETAKDIKLTTNCSLPDDYSDVLEILPSLCDGIGETSITFDLVQASQEDASLPLNDIKVLNNMRKLHEDHFDTSLWCDMPVEVRMFGLVEPFNAAQPLSLCKWPLIRGDNSATPCRHPRSSQIPLLTRPQMYYDVESLVEDSNAEGQFLVENVFENYGFYYESIDDCIGLTAHLCASDVHTMVYRNTGMMCDDLWESVHTTLGCLCLRSASCGNLGGSGAPATFRKFGKGRWQSELKNDMNHLKYLYDSHIRDLASRNPTAAKWLCGSYMSKTRAFVELVPFVYMLSSLNHPKGPFRKVDSSEHITPSNNIVTGAMLEQIDMMMAVGPHSSPTRVEPLDVSPLRVLGSMTPQFKEVLSELGKHYERNSNRYRPSSCG
ncbi:cell cycle checkpoint rad17 [Babesia ovis]|uniref:Cell cycle checkpoint rad17 n=1 Tax=Babesia ovis TaxID=5869 RepID=A0A9W5WUP3_BABOV|nr:cell cycle checkpoint rad17 [Babesia ovis]